MIHTVNRKIEMNKELRSKIEWACNINYLFFNEHEYFYIENLNNKHPISKFREIIGS